MLGRNTVMSRGDPRLLPRMAGMAGERNRPDPFQVSKRGSRRSPRCEAKPPPDPKQTYADLPIASAKRPCVIRSINVDAPKRTSSVRSSPAGMGGKRSNRFRALRRERCILESYRQSDIRSAALAVHNFPGGAIHFLHETGNLLSGTFWGVTVPGWDIFRHHTMKRGAHLARPIKHSSP